MEMATEYRLRLRFACFSLVVRSLPNDDEVKFP